MNKTLRFLNHDVLGPAGPFRERESLCMNVASSMLALLVALDFYKLYILILPHTINKNKVQMGEKFTGKT